MTNTIPLPNKKYNIILADPPWKYDFSPEGNKKNGIDYHYNTMTTEEIKNLSIPSDDNCVLFLWATAPKLKEAFEVITSWGFEYKTCLIWDKIWLGMGYWFRNIHELLLVATKGKISPPIPELRIPSIYREKKEGHSVKPDFIRYHIERCFPDKTKLELFARDRADGWDCYGNELSKTSQRRIPEEQ